MAMFSVVDLFVNFNSHAHVERDFPRLAEWIEQGNFNSHAHVERDPAYTNAQLFPMDFNSHAHVERD